MNKTARERRNMARFMAASAGLCTVAHAAGNATLYSQASGLSPAKRLIANQQLRRVMAASAA